MPRFDQRTSSMAIRQHRLSARQLSREVGPLSGGLVVTGYGLVRRSTPDGLEVLAPAAMLVTATGARADVLDALWGARDGLRLIADWVVADDAAMAFLRVRPRIQHVGLNAPIQPSVTIGFPLATPHGLNRALLE